MKIPGHSDEFPRRGMKRGKKFLKVFSLFSGIQSLSMICSVARAKLISLWIGPVGVGLNAVLVQTVELFNLLFSQGVRNASVSQLSEPGCGFEEALGDLRRVSLMGGALLGLLFTMASPAISLLAFGDLSHTWAMIALAPSVFFGAYTACELAAMQARGEMSRLAKASVSAVIMSTLIAVPLFYFFRLASIVPVIDIFFAFAALWAWIYRIRMTGTSKHAPESRETVRKIILRLRKAYQALKPVMRLSMWLTGSSLVAMICAYIFTVYLNREDSVTGLGCYQAGFTLLNTYLGVIFAVLSMEYFPRLSATGGRLRLARPLIAQQTMMITSVALPAVLCFILSSGFLLKLLYSEEFVQAVPMMVLGAPGVIARAMAYCSAYQIIIRGDGKVYLLTEALSGCVSVCLNIWLYRVAGFAGVGAAYTLWYVFYAGLIAVVCGRRYGLCLPVRTWVMCVGAFLGALAVAMITLFYRGE